jgi:hypothetical protein
VSGNFWALVFVLACVLAVVTIIAQRVLLAVMLF